MKQIKRYLPFITIAVFILLAIYIFSKSNKVEQEGKTTKTQEVHIKEETVETPSGIEKRETEPVVIKNFGWRPVAKTMPKPGYIWEWAVEIENQSPVTVTVQISYELKDQEDQIVGKGLGGDNIPPKESRIIVGKSSAPESIERARKQIVRIMTSPLVNDINWIWPNPYEIIVRR